MIASVPMDVLTPVGRFWHSPIWNAHSRSARAAGPRSVLLALGMVILAMSLGGCTMGLCSGFVMLRCLVACVFHVFSRVGRLIAAIHRSDLNSGGTECQPCFNRGCAPDTAIYIFDASLCFGFGTTHTAQWQAIACLEAAHKTATCRNCRFRYRRRWCHRLTQI